MRERYHIESNADTFSFKPFHHHRSRLKWYVLALLFFGGLSVYYYSNKPMNELFLIISTTFATIITWFFLQEILFYIPVRYIFDRSTNQVYQSTLFVSKRSIITFDEIVIFQSSEMGSWQYKIGKKKSQFIKSYEISEYFSENKNNEKLLSFEREILNKIQQIITKPSSTIQSNSIGSTSIN